MPSLNITLHADSPLVDPVTPVAPVAGPCEGARALLAQAFAAAADASLAAKRATAATTRAETAAALCQRCVAGAALARNDADSAAMLAHELATQAEVALAAAEARARAAEERGRREMEEIVRERAREKGEEEEEEEESDRKMNLLRESFRRRRGSRYSDEEDVEIEAESATPWGVAPPPPTRCPPLPGSTHHASPGLAWPSNDAPSPTPEHLRKQDSLADAPGSAAGPTPVHLRRQYSQSGIASPGVASPGPRRPEPSPQRLRMHDMRAGALGAGEASPHHALSPREAAGGVHLHPGGPPHLCQDSFTSALGAQKATPHYVLSPREAAGAPLHPEVHLLVGSPDLATGGVPGVRLQPDRPVGLPRVNSLDQAAAASTYRQRRRSKTCGEAMLNALQVCIPI